LKSVKTTIRMPKLPLMLNHKVLLLMKKKRDAKLKNKNLEIVMLEE
jgi:hypothetical protein